MGMNTLQELLSLMTIEEKARTCRSRAEAQLCIRHAEQARQKLWGTSEPLRFSS